MFSIKIRKLKEQVERFWGLTPEERDSYTELLKHKANLERTYQYICNDENLEELVHREIKLTDAKIDHFNRQMKEVAV